MAGKTLSKSPLLKPRLRVTCGTDIAIGPGKMELLAMLAETGSLNEAARRMNMSYMRAWMLVKTMNQCFRNPVAIAQRGGKSGGGMSITETGRQALALYQKMERDSRRACQASWKKLRRLFPA